MSESPTEHFEHAEHAEHVAHTGDPFLARVSITIAILAVAAATVGSLETIETAQTISAKTSAAIRQNQATDQWGVLLAAKHQEDPVRPRRRHRDGRQGGRLQGEVPGL